MREITFDKKDVQLPIGDCSFYVTLIVQENGEIIGAIAEIISMHLRKDYVMK